MREADKHNCSTIAGNRKRWLLEALESLVLFPPEDTASNLDPGNPADPNFPQSGHGSVKLGVLFTTPGPE